MTFEEYYKQNNLNKNDFNSDQMEEIRLGLQDNLDVSWYANPIYDDNQMEEIRLGLKDNLDVSKYADPKIHSRSNVWNSQRSSRKPRRLTIHRPQIQFKPNVRNSRKST